MKIYYSPSRKGFFDSSIHGTKTIMVEKQDWVRPSTPVLDVEGKPVLDKDGKPVVKLNWGVHPPMVEVQNPAYCMPDDVIEISLEQHTDLLKAQETGKIIVPGVNGAPMAIDPPPMAEKDKAMFDILVLEDSITKRQLRGAALGNEEDLSSLRLVEDKIKALRKKLK